MKTWLRGSLVLAVAIAASAYSFVACGGSDSGVGGSGAASGSGGKSPDGSSGAGGTKPGSGGSGGLQLDGGGASGGSGGFDDASACTGSTTTATELPLDMYVMMDISGSMTDSTAGGQTKWAAVSGAMTTFLNDPSSQGLGVGIQYFPLKNPNVPASCTSSSQCGSGGICVLKTCDQTPGNTVVACNSNADCAGMGQCVNLGQDCLNPQQLCAPGGNSCMPFGGCVKLTQSFCNNETSCTVGDYATPAVEITTLGSPQPLINSMNAQSPSGQTPTGPALQGAIQHATSWANAHPNHTVVVVLATDGLPTECAPTDIASVAQIAAGGVSGTPAIDTFVIGVFAPTDTQSPQNLNTIAQSGGTGSAFIVDTSGNVGQQFTDALNKIRGQALGCEFSIPPPPDGGALDYTKVNVSFTAGGQTQTIYYVGDPSQCDPTSGGWYYDVDPASGGTPTKIIACSATCNVFKQTTSGTSSVDVQLGCKTQIKPPA